MFYCFYRTSFTHFLTLVYIIFCIIGRVCTTKVTFYHYHNKNIIFIAKWILFLSSQIEELCCCVLSVYRKKKIKRGWTKFRYIIDNIVTSLMCIVELMYLLCLWLKGINVLNVNYICNVCLFYLFVSYLK